MIVRTWRGAVRARDADRYLDYLRRTGLDAYAGTEGNRGAMVLRDVSGDRAEFLVVSFWDSEEAAARFAGADDPGRAVFYPEDDRFLVDRDERVRHYELAWGGLPSPED